MSVTVGTMAAAKQFVVGRARSAGVLAEAKHMSITETHTKKGMAGTLVEVGTDLTSSQNQILSDQLPGKFTELGFNAKPVSEAPRGTLEKLARKLSLDDFPKHRSGFFGLHEGHRVFLEGTTIDDLANCRTPKDAAQNAELDRKIGQEIQGLRPKAEIKYKLGDKAPRNVTPPGR